MQEAMHLSASDVILFSHFPCLLSCANQRARISDGPPRPPFGLRLPASASLPLLASSVLDCT